MIDVILEVGHGQNPDGFEPGATSGGIWEYDLNWIAAQACRDYLEANDRSCQITDDDGSLYTLGLEAADAKYFISIHHNAFNSKAQGAECLVHQAKSEAPDAALAAKIAAYMAHDLGIANRGIKPRSLGVMSGAEDATRHFKYTNAQVLAECYFMDAVQHGHERMSARAGRAMGRAILAVDAE